MAKFKITKKTTVAELKEQFRKEVGGVLRVYAGRSEAAEDVTLVSLGAKQGELECRKSRTVGKFEEAFQQELNLKVKVCTKGNNVKVLDGITLEVAGKLPWKVSKEKMEAYLSYKRTGADSEDSINETTAESAEVPEEYKGLPIIIIETTEIDMDDDDNNSEIEFSKYPAVGVVFHGYESNCSQGAIIVSDDHDELFSEAKDFIDEEISDDEDIPVRVIETTKIIGYGQAENMIDELGPVIGCALNELYDGGNRHYKNYEWEDWFAEKAIFIVDDDVFIARNDGGIDFIDLSEEQLNILKKEIIKANAKDDNYDFSENLASVSFDGKYGYINTDGDFVIEPQFEAAGSFAEGVACVKTNGKYGYIDTNGKFVIEPQFDDAGSFTEGVAYVKTNGKYGYINTNGKFVIEPQFEEAESFAEGIAHVCINGKWGAINTTGKMVITPICSQSFHIRPFNEECFCVKIDNLYGLKDFNDQWIVEPFYDDIDGVDEEFISVEKDNKFGCINAKGEVVIPLKYDYVWLFKDGKAKVELDGKVFEIDQQGNKIG